MNIILFLFLFYSSSLLALNLEGVKLLSEENPPYNFTKDGKAKGLAVDILMETFKVIGIDRPSSDIQFFPWARAYRDAQNPTLQNIIFTITKTPKRNNLFKWVGPFAYGKSVIFGLPDKEIVMDFSTIKNKSFAVIRQDVSLLRLLEKGIKKSQITEVGTMKQLLKLLLRKRVDYISHGELTTYYAVRQIHNFEREKLKPVFVNEQGGLYFGLNKSISDKEVKRFNDGLLKVLSDHDFMKNNIYNKYY